LSKGSISARQVCETTFLTADGALAGLGDVALSGRHVVQAVREIVVICQGKKLSKDWEAKRVRGIFFSADQVNDN
jgi:hypothetical protein